MNLDKALSSKSYKHIGITLSIIAILGVSVFRLMSSNVKQIHQKDVHINRVQHGAIDINVKVYGELVAAKEKIITAPAQGRVSEILVRPGTLVDPDTVIFIMDNPALAQQLTSEESQLAQLKSTLQSLSFQHKTRLLEIESQIVDTQSQLEEAKLELKIHQELAELGVTARLKILRGELKVKQLEKRFSLSQNKKAHLVNQQRYEMEQKQLAIATQDSKLQTIKQQYQSLNVTAGISGVLQSLNITLGEGVQFGKTIGKVGSSRDLLAKLSVPQRKVDSIKIGAPLSIQLDGNHYAGQIQRIETIVENGMVTMEGKLNQGLPLQARPGLPISANILVAKQQNHFFVERHHSLSPMSSKRAYFIDERQNLGQKKVVFGDYSGDKLIIESGVSASDEFIIDTSNTWQQYPSLVLNKNE